MLLALYAQPEQDDLRCVAYEANGLQRNSVPDVSLLSALAFGSEQLSAGPMCVCAESLEFSADGQLLAALVRLGRRSTRACCSCSRSRTTCGT